MSILNDMIENMENNPGVLAAAQRYRDAPPREILTRPEYMGGVGASNPVCGVCFALLPWNNEYRDNHAKWHEDREAK